MAAYKRLQKEYEDFKKETLGWISACPVDDSNLLLWQASILGPTGTPYEGGLFILEIVYPTSYPFSPPKCTFKTKIYHPNINMSGGICIDLFEGEWSPAFTTYWILMSIMCLMGDPNPDDPLVGEIAVLYQQNRPQFEANARKWTKMYASQ
ncbi:hypothetical protein FGO68_gene16034 [Halteria grandinella]|uniref:E2 ubiquitin-conjugating enzyme n=1 Tax=Halteria grandinella TaxID=5974 RepID=A0A8J8NHA5_HALGN|nr:hypothetical protein FGO68_gene16034 [Halteria grandinella]